MCLPRDDDILSEYTTFNSDSVIRMCEAGSCRVISNTQEASAAGTKLVLYVPFCHCMSLDGCALAVGGLSETETEREVDII